MRILIVEDDPHLARTLQLGLQRADFAVDTADDGTKALERIRVYEYDVVVLDRDLPGIHGDDVCRRIVAEGWGCRVLMLTASAGVDATVEGLSVGADDYMAKPFAFPELVARLRTLARRSAPASAPQLEWGDLVFDAYRRSLTRAGRPVRLTGKELAVIEVLLRADGAVFSVEDLLDRAWSLDADGSVNAVRLVIASLRRKLGPPNVIETAVGVGYRMSAS